MVKRCHPGARTGDRSVPVIAQRDVRAGEWYAQVLREKRAGECVQFVSIVHFGLLLQNTLSSIRNESTIQRVYIVQTRDSNEGGRSIT